MQDAPETRAEIDALAARLAARHGDAPTRRDAAARRFSAVNVAQAAATPFPFAPEQAQCESHGAYPKNALDADGTLRWNPPGCPACRRAQAAAGLMQRAAIAPRFAACSFDNFLAPLEAQRVALECCREYARDFEALRARGVGLVLRGAPGTGKNHLATAIAHAVLARGYTVLNATAHEITGRVRESWRHANATARLNEARLSEAQVVAEFAALDLLIIDEVGRAYRRRDGADPIELFNVIDARYRRLAPTIVISNLDRAGIRAALGEAAFDRLREGGARLANFDWPSHRGPNKEE